MTSSHYATTGIERAVGSTFAMGTQALTTTPVLNDPSRGARLAGGGLD